MNIYYFDNAATTKLDEKVLKEMLPYLIQNYGNASSLYKLGRHSRKAVEISREKVASALNANKNEIYFTSGGSESDNTALFGIASAYSSKGKHIITSQIEHPAILETCKQLEKEGYEITYLPVDDNGAVSIEELKKAIKPSTILISIMFANNEIGTIQPIKEISTIAHSHGIIFHTDAVQAVGNVKIDVKELEIDALSLSGHKFYGPKGIGALYVSENIKFDKFINGGHQEKNMRAGTENVAGIVGLGEAINLADKNLEKHQSKMTNLRNYFFEGILKNFKDVKINGDLSNRLPGNANLSFKNINGNKILLDLDKYGICISTGSACSSSSNNTSHVLKAIKVPKDYINGSIRVTIGKNNTKEEVDYLLEKLKEIIK
mgnify:FL=1